MGVMANAPANIIELLATKKPRLVGIKNNEEVPPLLVAVKNRRLDVVKILVENGANVNDYDLDFENCLHLAASNCHYELIEYLLNETEVDSHSKNRDEMNPLCLLLVRARNEDQDLVTNCFFLMLEHSYEKNLLTNTYEICDIFQCAFLACVYSHTEVVKYLIHNVYSKNNSHYEFIRKLSELCDGENSEFLYYILVFFHDEIERYDKFCFPRFSEINYYMCIRSVIYIMDLLLTTSEAVELIVIILQHMEKIGFNIRVKEFEDQIGFLLGKYSMSTIQVSDLEKINGVFRYLLDKQFHLNSMVRSFLHSIAIAKDTEVINVDSSKKILRVLLYYATTFFVSLENWKQINDFKSLNPRIEEIFQWMLESFGNTSINIFLEVNSLLSLKQLCRNAIREQLRNDPKVLCNDKRLRTLGLPEVLINYLVYKEI